MDDSIFAAGDCATMTDDPRPRAGVFAVRQGPVLARNLMAAALGKPLETYRPQGDFLTILRSGKGRAIAGRGRFLALEGRWVWRWKDRIDRNFMALFQVADADPTDETKAMRCGGCAAKVGPEPLQAALNRLPPPIKTASPSITLGKPEDAAVINWDGKPLVQSVDQFRAFIKDAYLFGSIAANHALNDLYAMGATPHHALALATLPEGKPDKVAEELYQLLAGARATLDAAGCVLAGGHSSEGEALALGLSVSGKLAGPALTKTGAKPGDVLILTKPLGSGIVFAADMRASAPAGTVETMLRHMLLSNSDASQVLIRHGATAMTDVSGFGLIGHLGEMLAEGQGATLTEHSLPIPKDVRLLAEKGFASSLLPENRRQIRQMPGGETLPAQLVAILFDPQTAGGLLAAVPQEHARAALRDLQAMGYGNAAEIGAVTATSGIRVIF
jgi:selenide, water dikinase